MTGEKPAFAVRPNRGRLRTHGLIRGSRSWAGGELADEVEVLAGASSPRWLVDPSRLARLPRTASYDDEVVHACRAGRL